MRSASMEPPGRSGSLEPAAGLAHLGLGSNLAPDLHIVRAVLDIRARMQVLASSRFYRNPPHPPSHGRGQPEFVNGVLFVRVRSDLNELRCCTLREIESKLGRIRTSDPFADRVIDLDLLTFRSKPDAQDEEFWVNPEIVHRPYWAVPLAELAPHIWVPGAESALGRHAAAMKGPELVCLESLTAEIRRLLGLPGDD